MEILETKKSMIVIQNSLQEFFDYAIYGRDGKKGVDLSGEIFEIYEHSQNRSRENGYDFFGTDTWEEAVSLKDEPPKVELREIDSNIVLNKYNYDNKLIFVRDTQGCEVDIVSFLSGESENMFSFDNVQNNKFINIFLNFAANCSIDSADIMKAGNAYFSIIDTLEQSGYRCEVYLYAIMENSSTNFSFMPSIKAKGYKERLHLSSLFIPFYRMNVFLRRFYFSWAERFYNQKIREKIYLAQFGYSSPVEDEQRSKQLMDATLGDKKDDFRKNIDYKFIEKNNFDVEKIVNIFIKEYNEYYSREDL